MAADKTHDRDTRSGGIVADVRAVVGMLLIDTGLRIGGDAVHKRLESIYLNVYRPPR